MPLTKQAVNINFSQGLDTKTDPFQVTLGKFLSLQNSIFDKAGRLTKRNGYEALTSLPDTTSSFVTTFNGGLTAIGTELISYSTSDQSWFIKGNLQPIEITTLPLVRSNTNQSQTDTAVATNGLICTVYTDVTPAGVTHKYVIADSTTGQNIIIPTLIPGADPTTGTPRVFLLANYFVIVYTALISATHHLRYIAIGTNNPNLVTPPVDLASSYVPATTLSFDCISIDNRLIVAYNTLSGGQSIKVTYITQGLGPAVTPVTYAGEIATLMSLAVDNDIPTNPVVYLSYYDLPSTTGKVLAFSLNLGTILAPTLVSASGTILNLASTAQNGSVLIYAEVSNNYAYDSGIPTHYISQVSVTQSGTVGPTTILARSVGLASKAFLNDGIPYVLTVYDSPYQPTYFLLNGMGQVVFKLAYSNAGPYNTLGLPNFSFFNGAVQIPYLFKDLIQSVNKNTNVPAGSQVNGIYSQTGINLISFIFTSDGLLSAEIGLNLNLTGGFLWAFDGYVPVENGFFLYPDSVELTASTTGGNLSTQQYFYQVTYEWTDNQGNAFRSSPSIPVSVTTASATSSITIDVPTLRLTYKIANPVKIVIYRWSTAQQNYYQVTSIFVPLLNDPTVDYLTFVDTLADASILANNLLYTTGGVIENIGGPAFDSVFIFDDRLWGISSEDKNLLWYSKQIIENTPVEMSDLLTIYVAPNIGSQGPTGSLKCGVQMDDKAILFKASAINYFNGTGPDNTGANSQYSQPTFITSTVGCSNQRSIVFQPQGLMFEFASEAGNQIWLLGRDLSSQYIGAPVEALTQNATVLSAVGVPGTNQVRFTLDSGITLMYDYYFGQWGTFVNIPAISSCLFQGLHTYINSIGQVFQESPGVYLDGGNPVLMSFLTSWLNLAGLQGYQRSYFFYLLGVYYTAHKIHLQIAYDYSSAFTQSTLITPTNFAPVYGQDLTYGSGTPYGGPNTLEQWRIFLTQQRCQSFQILMNEFYDASYGVPAGQGLTLSGMMCAVGIKKGYTPLKASQSVGGL